MRLELCPLNSARLSLGPGKTHRAVPAPAPTLTSRIQVLKGLCQEPAFSRWRYALKSTRQT